MTTARLQSTLARLSRQGWRTWAVVALAYFSLCIIVLLLVPGGWAAAAGNLLAAPAGVAAARAALGLRFTSVASRLRRAWAYLGWRCACGRWAAWSGPFIF